MNVALKNETEKQRKERIRVAIKKRLNDIGEPHPTGCMLNHFYIDEWIEDPEPIQGGDNNDLYSEDIRSGRLYGDDRSGVSDLEEDHFWGVEGEWVYDEKGMRLHRA
jgi:hypothetical protein